MGREGTRASPTITDDESTFRWEIGPNKFLHLEISASKCGALQPEFATMETPESPQTAQSERKPERLEYRSPSVVKLGKLADVTLDVSNMGQKDGKGQSKTG
jgi:hypothetical protein